MFDNQAVPLDDRLPDYWVCACVKRDRQGNMTHIGSRHHSLRRCPECNAERPPAYDERPARTHP